MTKNTAVGKESERYLAVVIANIIGYRGVTMTIATNIRGIMEAGIIIIRLLELKVKELVVMNIQGLNITTIIETKECETNLRLVQRRGEIDTIVDLKITQRVMGVKETMQKITEGIVRIVTVAGVAAVEAATRAA